MSADISVLGVQSFSAFSQFRRLLYTLSPSGGVSASGEQADFGTVGAGRQVCQLGRGALGRAEAYSAVWTTMTDPSPRL